MRRLLVLIAGGAPTLALAQPDGAAPPPDPPPAAGAPDAAPAEAPPSAPASAPASGLPRLSKAVDRIETPSAVVIDLRGASQGECFAHALPDIITAGPCAVVGPYPGEIEGGSDGHLTDTHEEALEDCLQNPRCFGVSTLVSSDRAWYAVYGGAFIVQPASRHCTLLLKCPPGARPKPAP